METNFFQQLKDLQIAAALKITVQVDENGMMSVSVLPYNDKIKAKQQHIIPPLTLYATSTELDRQFFNEITAPLRVSDSIITNMQEITAAQAEAKKQTTAAIEAAKNKATSTASAPSKSNKYENAMKKVEELAGQKKFGEAFSALPKPDEYPEHKEAIEQKRNELMEKREATQNSLFGNMQQ